MNGATKGCGIVQGFHRDDLVTFILERRPEQRGEWLLPSGQPALGQRVKVQVFTELGTWGIMTGRITEVGDGFVVANAHRTTDDDTVPCGPFRLTLQHNERLEYPWVLTHAESPDPG